MPEAANPGSVESPNGEQVRPPALVVDLDGTLVKTDLLVESVLILLKAHLWYIFLLPVWLFAGKARLKFEVAERVTFDVDTLPYREELLAYLREQRNEGRTLVLATAGTAKIAEQVAGYLKLFDIILASDAVTNLAGEAKRHCLVRTFGEKGFDYAGNSQDDCPVWASARRAIVVDPDGGLRSRVAELAPVEQVVGTRKTGWLDYVKALRPEHWLKNLLVFVPLLLAHRLSEPGPLRAAALAFVAFGCFASAGYLINDLFDMPADRLHPRKRFRPFAAGDLPLTYALVMIPALLVASSLLAAHISGLFAAVVIGYFGVTTAYSLILKKIAILDVLVLAGLYTLRIVGGAVAAAIWPSPWILLLAVFLFFSLALVKRYSELVANHVNARGYELSDQELLASMGIASGYVATFVLALYLTTAPTHRSPVLWLLCPLLMYWMSYVWLSAHRGKMPDDPVVFITTDWTSRIVLLLMLGIVALGL